MYTHKDLNTKNMDSDLFISIEGTLRNLIKEGKEEAVLSMCERLVDYYNTLNPSESYHEGNTGSENTGSEILGADVHSWMEHFLNGEEMHIISVDEADSIGCSLDPNESSCSSCEG
jgi:hypothetical protein